jgi:serine/threonine protein kinase
MKKDTPTPLSEKPDTPPTPAQTAGQSTPRRSFLPGTRILNKYKVLEELGKGGMGIVYKVRQIVLKDIYALKILHSTTTLAATRFQKEAQAAHRLDHPNLVRVVDFGLLEDDTPYLVMDYVEGTPLSKRIRAAGFLGQNEAVALAIQICDGLQYAHNRGVVHRDLKPSNIILSKAAGNTRVKIVDFGVAKILEDNSALTRTGDAVGSPAYMSPEQCTGQAVDNRSDIYALGCTLFEMLTGMPPFEAENAFATMVKHKSEEPPTLKEVCLGKQFPAELEQIIARALAKNPSRRYQDAESMKNDLLALQSGKPISRSIEETFQPQSNNKKLIISAVALTLAVLTYAYFALNTTPKPVRPINDSAVSLEALPIHTTEVSHIEVHNKFAAIPLKEAMHSKVWTLNFPDVDLGLMWPAGIPDRDLITARRRMRGTVNVSPVRPLHIRTDLVLNHQPDLWRHFRPDEVSEIDFAQELDFRPDTLFFINHLTGLKSVDVSLTDVSDKDLQHIADLPNLEILSVKDAPEVTPAGLLHIKRLKQLKELQINKLNPVSPVIAALKGSTALVNLSVRSTALSDDDLAIIASLPNLAELDAAACKNITDKGVARLASAQNLEQLNIERTQVTAASIDTLRKLPKLRCLWVSKNNWKEADQRRLERALPNTSLESPTDPNREFNKDLRPHP